MRVADYIFKTLADYGVKHVFMVSGGGAMHLNDALGKEKRIKYICNHHEQACAIAAEGYARVTNTPGVICVTTGPGGTNALTGVIGAWLDSIPMIIVSGQVKFETTIASCPELGLRQLGDQELNIVDVVKPITKYAAMVTDGTRIKYHLEKAWHLATSGRPGPVWLDIPMNIQASELASEEMASFTPPSEPVYSISDQIKSLTEMLAASNRPVILSGHGIRLANAISPFEELINKLRIPVLSTFNGMDIVSTSDPLAIGKVGTIGTRAGNFTLQNADLVICIGTRNNIRQASYNWENFAKRAKLAVVDIDERELNKPTVVPDLKIHSDARYFIEQLTMQLDQLELPDWSSWLNWAQQRKEKYPALLPEYSEVKDGINPYYFTDCLTAVVDSDSIIVSTNATPSIALFQAGNIQKGQRAFANSGCASMGYGLPAALGAACVKRNQVICLEGDGSLMMNLQELQTVSSYNLPVKLFLFNNSDYTSIRLTQDAFFKGDYCGCTLDSGVTFPDWKHIASAFGFEYIELESTSNLKEAVLRIVSSPGRVFCNVKLCEKYIFQPKTSSKKLPDGSMQSSPLEDMFPFLDEAELKSNIIAD